MPISLTLIIHYCMILTSEIRQSRVVVSLHQPTVCAVTDLADSVCFPFSREKLWVDLCECRSSLPVSSSAVFPLTFTSPLKLFTLNHMSRQMYREQSKGCQADSQPHVTVHMGTGHMGSWYLFILMSHLIYNLWSSSGLQPFNETELPNVLSFNVFNVGRDCW